MVPVTEEGRRIPEMIEFLCEGGMLVHPTEPILLRGGLKGGGEATTLLAHYYFEEGIYT